MLYTLKQGPTEKKIMEQCAMHRMPLPDSIANAPELHLGLELYYKAFLDLTSCRGQGYGTEGPISWLAIREYAQVNEFTEEQVEDLFFFIPNMDAEYLKYKADKLKSQTGGNSG